MNTLNLPTPISFEHSEIGRGVRVVYGRIPGNDAPVSFLWHGGIQGDKVSIVYVWTNDDLRLRGIGRATVNELRRWYPAAQIHTAKANALSEPFLLAVGFRREPDGWHLPPAPHEPKQ